MADLFERQLPTETVHRILFALELQIVSLQLVSLQIVWLQIVWLRLCL